jgi:hypothetical protein
MCGGECSHCRQSTGNRAALVGNRLGSALVYKLHRVVPGERVRVGAARRSRLHKWVTLEEPAGARVEHALAERIRA